MAGGACAGAAAGGLERDAPVADHLHDAPALQGLERMLAAMMVDDEENNLLLSVFRVESFQGGSRL
jgi:hypothetical protein